MKAHHKLLFNVIALTGIFFGTTLATNSTANASSWKKGMPSVFRTKSMHIWATGFQKINNGNTKSYYQRTSSPFGKNIGYNPTSVEYNIHKKKPLSGADAGAGASVNPHYLSLGNGWYKITSGVSSKYSDALKYELASKPDVNSAKETDGLTSLVKVHSKNSVSIWTYRNNSGHGKKDYQGKFYKHGKYYFKQMIK